MNQAMIDHVDAWLEKAGNFVCAYMPMDISVDAAYEELLRCGAVSNVEGMIEAFREAVKYIPPRASYSHLRFVLGDGRTIGVEVRFTPTQKWRVFLFPSQDFTINPMSKFAKLLDMPVRVATEWAHLCYMWKELRKSQHQLSDAQLVHLMPWLRECLADFDPMELSRNLTTRKQIANEHARIMRDVNVTHFPRLSRGLSDVARSGRILISQYRMLDAAYGKDQLVHSPIVVQRDGIVEPWLKEHLAEAMDMWHNDRMAEHARQLQAARLRENKRWLNK